MSVGGYLEYTNHPKGPIVMGLGVLFLSFILMPVFIYWRYRHGKYKKYVIKDDLFFPKKDQNCPTIFNIRNFLSIQSNL
jgi:hypothetical protein